jgi:hypothetical protein
MQPSSGWAAPSIVVLVNESSHKGLNPLRCDAVTHCTRFRAADRRLIE